MCVPFFHMQIPTKLDYNYIYIIIMKRDKLTLHILLLRRIPDEPSTDNGRISPGQSNRDRKLQ